MTGALNTPLTLSGRYQLERQLGRGAMGAVYLARDLKHGREVAVKVLAPEATHALDADRFLSEIRTAAALNHPHILTVHDSGEEDGTLYYVMPRVEGESLRDLLDRERRLPVAEAVDITCQIAAGLAYAHAQGVVHRDIKPGNVLLDRTGHVYIADFGLALALSSVSNTRRTAAGVTVGSPLYMSPEQAGGRSDVDARSDIYALGCVLFEMLTGEPPFEAASVREVLLLHMTAPPPSLRSRRADVPPSLEHAVRTALAKDPADRYPTAEAFSRAIQMDADTGEARREASPRERRWPARPVLPTSPGDPRVGNGVGATPDRASPSALLRLRKSRVVQWLLAYLATGWVVLEASSMAGEVFDWPTTVLRAAMLLFGIGAVAVTIVVWFYARPGARPRRPWLFAGLAAAAALVLGALVLRGTSPVGALFGGFGPALDTTRYAILPFQREAGVPRLLREDLQLHEAFEGWRELQLVSRLQVGDAVQRTDGGAMTAQRALDIARRLGAGRYVFGVAAVVGDSVRLDASLYDAAAEGRELSRASVRVPLREVVPSNTAVELANVLLFGRLSGGGSTAGGTNSILARRAYGDAHAAVGVWDLPRADSLFDAAARHDPDFVRAHFWLAQVRNWAGGEPATWRTPAERAARDLAALSAYEQALARGLALLAGGEFREACEVYNALRERDEHDFAAWYGLGECRRLDDTVVPDPGSPSGWRFRSSYHQAVEAYRRAFETLPLTHRGATFDRLLEVFYTRPNRVRVGRRSELSFAAFPALRGDTLVFVPYPSPWDSPEWGRLRYNPATTAALLHQRAIVQELAERWAAAYPGSPDALEALAISLDMIGDAQTVDAYRRARAQSNDPAQRARLGAGEAWARVKVGLPGRVDHLVAAREIADSVLVASRALPRPADRLAALAILVGDSRAAAAYARAGARPLTWAAEVPRSVNATAGALLAFAAAGGPVDSIAALEAETARAIRNTIPPGDQDRARQQLLQRPAFLAAPVYRSRLFDEEFAFTAPVAEAYSAARRGETSRALELLTGAGGDESRATGNVTFDTLYPTAWLLAALGHPVAAAARLDAGFAALAWAQPGILDHPAHAGGLIRAVGLRARLAALADDRPTAELWRAAFDALWGGADPELRRAALRTPTPPQR